VYFKGGWIYKFNPASQGTFYDFNGQPQSVSMMTLRKKLPYGVVKDMAEWISIPYNSSDSLIVIKPIDPRISIEQVTQNLDAEDVDNMIESLYRDNYANVNLTMPKFKTTSTSNLVKPLQQMGVQKIFSQQSEINRLAVTETMQVSNAFQQTYMEVNEEGSIATSLTSFSVVALSFTPPVPNIEFTIDRPFLAMIVNRERKFPYFVAKICSP
jgi:serine protease inhibitor